LEALGRTAEASDSFRQARASAPLNHPRRRPIEAKMDSVPSGSWKELWKLPLRVPATFAFTAISIGVWLLQGDLGKIPKLETLIARGALVAPRVWDGEYWRLVSAMFLHVGAIHLFCNMYFGFGFCVALERLLGTWRFALGYLLSGIGASAVSLLGHFTVSAGASGALYGALGMVLAVFYAKVGSWRLFFVHPPVRRMLRMIVLWFVLGLTVLPLDNFAHFGGMVFGAGLGLLFTRGPVWSPGKRRAAWAGMLVLLAAVSVGACIPRPGGEEFVAEMRVLQADTEANKGQFKKALAHFDEAVVLAPRNPGVIGNRGLFKLRMGDLSGARRDIQAALDVAPPGWEHEAQLRKTLQSLRPDREY
jgi:membrane associated rhomboid family serine protease